MLLPQIAQQSLDVSPLDWKGLSKKYMNPGELEVLIALIKRVRPESMVEFGVNEGRTAKVILREVHSIVNYFGIDVERGYVTECAVQRREVPDDPGALVKDNPFFHLVVQPRGSHDLSANDFPWCDAWFIDGDHSERGVRHDSELAFARCSPGGIIIWHDYHNLGTVGVREVLDSYKTDYGHNIFHVRGTWLAYERIPL